jgi:hypothetical protein
MRCNRYCFKLAAPTFELNTGIDSSPHVSAAQQPGLETSIKNAAERELFQERRGPGLFYVYIWSR